MLRKRKKQYLPRLFKYFYRHQCFIGSAVINSLSLESYTLLDMSVKELMISIDIYAKWFPSLCETYLDVTEGGCLHSFLVLFSLKAQAMALTIADAFKMAFINYEKMKFVESHSGSRLPQYDIQEPNQQGDAAVNQGFVDTDTNPKTTTADLLNAPIIQVTEGISSPPVEEDIAKKIQALVKFILLV